MIGIYLPYPACVSGYLIRQLKYQIKRSRQRALSIQSTSNGWRNPAFVAVNRRRFIKQYSMIFR